MMLFIEALVEAIERHFCPETKSDKDENRWRQITPKRP